VYKRVSAVAPNYVYAFFSYVHHYKELYSCNEVYYAIDSDHYLKKQIDEEYKANRGPHERDPKLDLIKMIIMAMPHHNLLLQEGLEADDIAYEFCKKNDGVICISEDLDWCRNLLCGSNTKLFKHKKLISRHNVQQVLGVPFEKIDLYLFLQGDAKDNVKKPFRVKSHEEAMGKYNTPEEYCLGEGITSDTLGKYKELLYPIEGKGYNTIEGKKSEATKQYIQKYRLNFLNPSYNEGGLF